MNEYNKDLCDKIQKDFTEKIATLFSKIEKLEGRINWFYILAISTLVMIIGNIVKDVLK